MSSQDDRWHPPTVRHSIRTRVLALLLSLTTISVLTVGYIGTSSVQGVGESAKRISTGALRTQAEEYLRQVTVGDAQRFDLILKKVQDNAQYVAQYATSVFERPDAFARGGYWRAKDRLVVGPHGQFMNDPADVSSVFVPNTVKADDAVMTDLESSAYLDFVFAPTFKGNSNIAAIYLGTERQITRYYPNINLGAVVPPDFVVTQRPWYTGATLQNNPDRKVIWSPVYVDATGKGLLVTAAAPVYTGQDKFIGVVGIDFTLKDISVGVEKAQSRGGDYSFLVDKTGHAIVLPDQGYLDILGRSRASDEFGTDLSGAKAEFTPVLAKMTAGETGFDAVKVEGKEMFVAYAPFESTGWSLGNVVETEAVLRSVSVLQKELEASIRSLLLARILPIGGIVLVVIAVIGLWLANRLADPIRRMAIAAQRIGAGQWDAPLPQMGKDEIGVLAQAFAAMTVQLRDLMASLERRVAERTDELAQRSEELEKTNRNWQMTSQQAERRATQLTASAQVARAASQVRDLDQLLPQVTHLISRMFGYYHVGIFIVDELGRFAVLRAANSEGGQRMLARDHKLAVGTQGIVGHVVGAGQPRIALDAGADAVHFDNPDLPQTRSEMALPLRVGGQVFGALDVQSTQADAFTDEDIAILSMLADQVAIAIENARLLAQTQAALREAQETQRHYQRQEWERLLPTLSSTRHEYHASGVPSVGDAALPEIERAIQQSDVVTMMSQAVARSALAVPIKLRDQVIGVIDLHETEAEREWTADDVALVMAVADQAGLALENARLLEQTQQRARREQLVTQIATKVRAAADVEGILRTGVQEIRRVLGASHGIVHLRTESLTPTPDAASRPGNSEVVT